MHEYATNLLSMTNTWATVNYYVSELIRFFKTDPSIRDNSAVITIS